MSNEKSFLNDKIAKIFKEINSLSELLYPYVCPVCGKLLPSWQDGELKIHPACMAKLLQVSEPMCMKCGKPLAEDERELCYDCSHNRRSFQSGRGLWVYDKNSSEAVFSYKYGKKREMASFFARALENKYGNWIRSISPDAVIPVPLSREKMRSRGFNQAELAAGILAQDMGLRFEPGALVRIRSTSPQKELDPARRRDNLKKAFRACPDRLEHVRKVLLIDDIYTTGATIEYCSRALIRAGADKVWFLTICTGAPF